MTSESKSLDQIVAAIQALDLTPIKFKATRKEDGYGWSAERANQVEIAYKRYLILHAKYPEMTLAPDQDVDRLWHMHILDTRKYAADCQATFGHFLHHFPYLGLRGEDDAKALDDAFRKQKELYAKEFGEPVPALQKDAAWCSLDLSRASAAWCSLDASSQKAAWCSLDASSQKAAWCSLDASSQKAAWCSLDASSRKAAWCSLNASSQNAAWCSLDASSQKAAWCSLNASSQEAAWCSLETSSEKAAWCSLETAQQASA